MNILQNSKLNIGISFLKIVGIVIIFFHHYQQVTGLRFKNIINFHGGGVYFGYIVELFFIISGFLTYKYIDIILNNNINFKDFYLKKYFKFYPHIIISIIVYLTLNLFHRFKYGNYDFISSINLFDFFISSLGVQQWGMFENPGYNNPMYYVSILMFCYILFYFLCYISNRIKINVNYFFLLLILFGQYILKQKINFLFLNSSLYRGYSAFFIGILIAGLNNLKVRKSLILILIAIFIYIFVCPKKQYYLFTFIAFPLTVLYFAKYIFRNTIFCNVVIFLDKYTFYTFVWHSIYLLLYKLLLLPSNGYLMIISLILCWMIGIIYYHLIGISVNKLIFGVFDKVN